MSKYITEPDIIDCSIEIVAEAFQLRDGALDKARDVKLIEDAFDAEIAAEAMRDLHEVIKGIEASRTAAKAPALTVGRRIDSIAKEFIEDAKEEHARIRKSLGAWQSAEAQKKRDAEREARRKEQAILDAAADKQRQRIAEESKGRTGKMLEEVDAINTEADALVAKVRQEASASHSAVSNVRVRKTIKHKILDEAALLKARPDLFTADDRKIRAALKLTKTIPGLEIWEETTAY